MITNGENRFFALIRERDGLRQQVANLTTSLQAARAELPSGRTAPISTSG